MSIVMSVNAGSSSLKFQVFKMPEEEVLAQGNVERIGLNDSIFGMKANGEKIEEILDIKDHAVAVKKLMEALIEHKVVNSLEDIKAIGHRVVHGGEYFSHSVPVDADVEAKVEELCALAPLHNPAALVGYRSFRDALPECKHTFVFDTAFHQSMPEENYIFPLQYEYYTKDKVRRYGAHGTSHEYLTKRLAELQGKTQEEADKLTLEYINKPGGSDHNLGLAVDFNYVDNSFAKTSEYKWLLKNAENYGFILRYPEDKEDKTKIAYESWHWRYVGEENAKRMNELNMCLEEYVEYLQKGNK